MNICNRKRIGRCNQSFFNNKYSGPFYESEEGYVDASLENQTLVYQPILRLQTFRAKKQQIEEKLAFLPAYWRLSVVPT